MSQTQWICIWPTNILLAALIVLLGTAGLAASDEQPEMRQVTRVAEDCTDYLKTSNAEGIYVWQDLVEVEHCDRIKRLSNIARTASMFRPPEFFDGSIVVDSLPKIEQIKIPILRVVFPDRAFFNTGKSDLLPDAVDTVKIIASSLREEPPDVAVFIVGHADARGSRAMNLNLSVDRANAIAAAVLLEGVNLSSVWRVGFGEDMPLEAGNSNAAYTANRRVELLFAARPEAIADWIAKHQIKLLCSGKNKEQTESCKATLSLGKVDAIELSAPTVHKNETTVPEKNDIEVNMKANDKETEFVSLPENTLHEITGKFDHNFTESVVDASPGSDAVATIERGVTITLIRQRGITINTKTKESLPRY